MTILLDTTVIIDVLRDRRERRNLLRELLQGGHTLACCGINVTEVYAGMRPHEAGTVASLFRRLEYVEISSVAAQNAGRMMQEWRSKGRTLSLPDAVVAAVALSAGLALATDNARDFPMTDLKLLSLPGA